MRTWLSWNIRQGGGRRVPLILERLAAQLPEVVVLTEFRHGASGARIREGLDRLGLVHQLAGDAAPRANTVLLASRSPLLRVEAPGLAAQDAHRCLVADLDGLRIVGVYFAQNRAKASLFSFLLGLPEAWRATPTLILGDFNTGRHRLDEAGATFYCADQFERLAGSGWVDLWRARHGEERTFSWFSNAGNGFRIDHAFGSPALLPRVGSVDYSHLEREQQWSDHSSLVLGIESATAPPTPTITSAVAEPTPALRPAEGGADPRRVLPPATGARRTRSNPQGAVRLAPRGDGVRAAAGGGGGVGRWREEEGRQEEGAWAVQAVDRDLSVWGPGESILADDFALSRGPATRTGCADHGAGSHRDGDRGMLARTGCGARREPFSSPRFLARGGVWQVSRPMSRHHMTYLSFMTSNSSDEAPSPQLLVIYDKQVVR